MESAEEIQHETWKSPDFGRLTVAARRLHENALHTIWNT